ERARQRGVTPAEKWVPPPAADGPGPPVRLAPVEGADFPWSRAVEIRYRGLARSRAVDALRRRVLSSLRARLKRARRTLEKVRADRARIEEAERYRRLGDLLKPALGG